MSRGCCIQQVLYSAGGLARYSAAIVWTIQYAAFGNKSLLSAVDPDRFYILENFQGYQPSFAVRQREFAVDTTKSIWFP